MGLIEKEKKKWAEKKKTLGFFSYLAHNLFQSGSAFLHKNAKNN